MLLSRRSSPATSYASVTIVRLSLTKHASFDTHVRWWNHCNENVRKWNLIELPWKHLITQNLCHHGNVRQPCFGSQGNIGQHALAIREMWSIMLPVSPFSISKSRWKGLLAVSAKLGKRAEQKAIQKLLHKVVRMFRVWWNVLLESFRFFLHALLYLENFSRFTVVLNNKKNKNHSVHPSILTSCITFTKAASNTTIVIEYLYRTS